jgi:hypothetical protein
LIAWLSGFQRRGDFADGVDQGRNQRRHRVALRKR